MLPARFLQPWEVLDTDTQDMGGKILHGQQIPTARGGQGWQVRIRVPTMDQGRRERG